MDFSTKLGKNISRIRNNKGLTQAVLSEKADVAVSTVARIELGEGFPQMDTLKKIAFALNVDLEELFNFVLPLEADSEKTDLIEEMKKHASKANKAELIYFITMMREYNKSIGKE